MLEERHQSLSPWSSILPVDREESLAITTSTDVCVVGAGVAGLTTAYLLARQGKRVVVLERDTVGAGETSRTTAHLSNAIDDRYYEIERIHGEQNARLVAESHTAAIDTIERICREEGIDCEFRRVNGYLFLAKGHSLELLERELAAAHRAGLVSVEMCQSAPVPSLSARPPLRFPFQGQLHPTKYLLGLAAALRKAGGTVYPHTLVKEVHGGPSAKVVTAGGIEVLASAVVVATNTPMNDRFVIHTKQAAYRTYALGFSIPKGVVPIALYWDTHDPYHYVRIETVGESDLLIVGGEDHRTGQSTGESKRLARLEAWARRHFACPEQPAFQWSGQVEETIDGLAFIGRNPADAENVFIATGDSGMGMTHGTIAGLLLTDLILGRPNPWEKVYEPSRMRCGSLRNWMKENTNTVSQYRDHLTPGDLESTARLQPGEGAVIRRGLSKVAAYRDEQGVVHIRSAVCPHLQGIVHWNSLEKTWDCPCHGSRFSSTGGLLHGPAASGLAPLKTKNKRRISPERPARQASY